MTRGLYKQPGGKLVGVTVRLSHADPDCTDSDYADSDYIDSAHTNAVKTVPYAGPAASSTVIECHIDGDFFLDGDDAGTRNLLHSMECALEQCAARCLSGSMVSERDVTAAVERTMLHHPDVRIVGMGARGIAIAFQRAIDGIDGADGIAGIGGNDVTKVEPRDDLRIRRHTSPMETAETAEIAKNIENAGTAESDENAGTVGTGEIAETGNWAEYARRWHALKPNIVHDDPRPIVLTGAQHAADHEHPDGPENLAGAIAAAADPLRRNNGVLLHFGDATLPARGLLKRDTHALDAFTLSSERPLPRPATLGRAPLADLRVPILRAWPGAEGDIVDAVANSNPDGIVIEALGSGNVSPGMGAAIARALGSGIPVVITSSVPYGEVTFAYGGAGGGATLGAQGAIAAGFLRAGQARIALATALANGVDPASVF